MPPAEIDTRDLQLIEDARELVSRELAKLRKLSAESGEMPGPWKPRDLVHMAEAISKLDARLSARAEDEATAKPELDFERLSLEELRQLEELMRKASRR